MSLRNFALYILHIFLVSCTAHYVKHEQKFEHYSLKAMNDEIVFSDSLKRFKHKVDSATGRVIASSQASLIKEGDESTLGNFVCDALKSASEKQFKNQKVDLVIVNRGGLRTNLPKGEIRAINIFELMPFENELVLVKLKGAELRKIFPLIVEKKHPILGARIKIQDQKLTEFLIQNKPLENEIFYTIATSDYLASGGDNFSVFTEAEILRCDLKIRDAIIQYCEQLTSEGRIIIPYKDGRLEVSK